jgi:hypothetical protein
LTSPWGGSGLDLPSTPSSPSTSSRPTALQTPPRSTRSPMAAKGVSVTVTDDMRSMPALTSNCLLSEYNPFPPTPGSPGNLGGYGAGFGSGLGSGLLSPSSGGPERGVSKGLGRSGYAAKAGYGGSSSGTRDLSIAASRSRRRTSNSSDQTDNGRL